MFPAAMCILPRIVDLGLACLQSMFPALESMLATVTDCSRFIRVLSLMSQISCLYKADVFPPLLLLATSAHHRCLAVVGPPQALPSTHASRDNVTSEVQREAAEAYCSMMLLMCNMMATAPAGSFAHPAAASLIMTFTGTASAVARHTSDISSLKQAVFFFRRLMDHVSASPLLQASLTQVPSPAPTSFCCLTHATQLLEAATLASFCIPLHPAFDPADAQVDRNCLLISSQTHRVFSLLFSERNTSSRSRCALHRAQSRLRRGNFCPVCLPTRPARARTPCT
jgi:hypothetical protein